MEERAKVGQLEECFEVDAEWAEAEARAGPGPHSVFGRPADARFRRVQDGHPSRYAAAGWVEDLSLGGAFVRTGAPLDAETRIEIELLLPTGRQVTTSAVVLFTEMRGMAVRFGLDPEVIAALHEALTKPPRRGLVALPHPCPASASLTRSASTSGVNGFESSSVPGSRTPWWAIASSV